MKRAFAPPPIYFITGTDTGVGKTLIAAALLELARDRGWRCAALKPVAAGCERRNDKLANEDALALMAASGADLDYATVNPVALEPAIAPHIAAAEAGVSLSAAQLAAHCRRALAGAFDFALIEGAGGWLAPLNATETLADLCILLNARPILVVGMQLGCLNHALLTAAAIARAGLDLAGWVANCPAGEMPRLDDNLATLSNRLPAPCLGLVPQLGAAAQPSQAHPYIDISRLEPSAKEQGATPRKQEPSAGEREGATPRKQEPSAGEREGATPRKQKPPSDE